MNNNGFVRRYYRYVNRNIPIPDFDKIDISKYDFSKHFENVPLEIDISKIDPFRLAEKLACERRIMENQWGEIGDSDKLNIRQYVQMEKLTPSDYNWDRFDEMAYRYQYFLRKKLNHSLTVPEKIEMENLYAKMLSCMIHFYTKKESYHLQSSSPTVDLDDYDSVIALTLIKCLALHDLSQKDILNMLELSEGDAGVILYNEFGIEPDFWFSAKEMLFSIIEKKKDYFSWNPSPYIVNGQIWYPQEAYCDFYQEIIKLAKRNKIVVCEPRTYGFNRRKAQKFSYYLCASIDKELYKLYRRQIVVHVPYKHKVPNEVINPIAILTKDEYSKMNYSPDYYDHIDGEISKSFGVPTNPADIFEEDALNVDFYKKVKALDYGDVLLYKVGVDYIPGQNIFLSTKKRTFKDTGIKFGISEYEAKKIIKQVATEFKKKYPNFYAEYTVA